ncbi:type III-D CRISPR-associated protein Csx19 [Frankia sp. CiP1_Cm_nod2]
MTTHTAAIITLHTGRSTKISLPDAIRQANIGDAVALLASARKYTVARLSGGRLTMPGSRSFADGAGVAGTSTERELPLPTSGPAAVFEARIFNRDAELRWLHERDGLGTAVLLSESPALCQPPGWLFGEPGEPDEPDEPDEPGEPDRPVAPLTAIDRINNKYLLWGRPLRPNGSQNPNTSQASDVPRNADATGGPLWVRLAEARIGLLDVPVPRAPREDECVFLETIEYVTTDEHAATDGNATARPRHGNAYVAEERLVGLASALPSERSEADDDPQRPDPLPEVT